MAHVVCINIVLYFDLGSCSQIQMKPAHVIKYGTPNPNRDHQRVNDRLICKIIFVRMSAIMNDISKLLCFLSMGTVGQCLVISIWANDMR